MALGIARHVIRSVLRSLLPKVPESYHYKQRTQLAYDAKTRIQSEERGVDTSDLHTKEEEWHGDEAEATLLGYAELEVMGHKVSGSAVEFDVLAALRGCICVIKGPFHRGRTKLLKISVLPVLWYINVLLVITRINHKR